MSSRILPLVFLLLLAQASQGVPMTFTFFQGGYADGASISGAFKIDDLNGNGLCSNFPEQELYFCSAFYSGSASIPSLGGAVALGIFSFNLSTYSLTFSAESGLPGFPLTSIDVSGSSLGSIFYLPTPTGTVLTDHSTSPLIITRQTQEGVPDGGTTIALLSVALSALLAIRCTDRLPQI